ncbi:hypothetical protein GF386_04240 [Candidatus Pacearchaeota archaeon]|nr:hypothetical protein [Candidatus Pacearchaeota archaeon]MBD3283334.1 hypothetical protein [Candidatus Pacearchaeota archaeon]
MSKFYKLFDDLEQVRASFDLEKVALDKLIEFCKLTESVTPECYVAGLRSCRVSELSSSEMIMTLYRDRSGERNCDQSMSNASRDVDRLAQFFQLYHELTESRVSPQSYVFLAEVMNVCEDGKRAFEIEMLQAGYKSFIPSESYKYNLDREGLSPLDVMVGGFTFETLKRLLSPFS